MQSIDLCQQWCCCIIVGSAAMVSSYWALWIQSLFPAIHANFISALIKDETPQQVCAVSDLQVSFNKTTSLVLYMRTSSSFYLFIP